MKRTGSLLVVLAMALSASVASAELIYVNDFGTEAQRTVGGNGEWDSKIETPRAPLTNGYVPTVTLVYFPNGWNAISQELDGDSLHGGLSLDGWGGIRWIKRIDAAAGFGFSDISLTIHGHAASYQQCQMGVALSADGVNWDYADTKIASWKNYPDNTLMVSSGADAKYTDASSVWIAIDWYNGTNHFSEPWYTAYITDVTVQGTVAEVPEPMTVGLLAVGAVGLLAKRRKQQ